MNQPKKEDWENEGGSLLTSSKDATLTTKSSPEHSENSLKRFNLEDRRFVHEFLSPSMILNNYSHAQIKLWFNRPSKKKE